MYNFLFTYFYYYFIRFKDQAPKSSAILVVSLLQFLHLFSVCFFTLKFLGIGKKVFAPIQNLNPVFYGLIPMIPLFTINFIYYNKGKTEKLLGIFKRENTLNTRNSIIAFSLLLVPIVLIFALSSG